MPLFGVFIDPLYIVLFVVTLVISGAAQLYIRSTFAKWDDVTNGARLSGYEIGERLVNRSTFGGAMGPGTGISFKVVADDLSDYSDLRARSVPIAAALTYVAAAATSILTLLYDIALARR